MDFEKEYQKVCETKSDINEHLPWMSEIITKHNCKSVVEFGVGYAVSTRAFMRHDIQLNCYEIVLQSGVKDYFNTARKFGRNINLHLENTTSHLTRIPETDILLIDSYHSYDHVMVELKYHAHKVKKYIFFHDTTKFAHRGEGGEPRGVWDAVEQFLSLNTEWELIERRTNNNGMTLIGRKQ